MALIECPECGGKVSDRAHACIHCGYPLQESKEEQVQQIQYCPYCGKTNCIENIFCGYCGKSFVRGEEKNDVVPVSTERQLDEQRRQFDAQAKCAKCGNPIEDDMMFCQKCGTKSERAVSTAQSDIEVKLAKMKKYNLVIDASLMSWQYIYDDSERAGNVLAKQNQMCHELQDLIVDILSSADDKTKDFAEREVYTYILDLGRRMCLEGAKMFAD